MDENLMLRTFHNPNLFNRVEMNRLIFPTSSNLQLSHLRQRREELEFHRSWLELPIQAYSVFDSMSYSITSHLGQANVLTCTRIS